MMRLNQKSKTRFFLLLLLGSLSVGAQSQKGFKYQSAVQKVGVSGFYRIALQPLLVAKSNAGLSDLRLVDAKGNFLPYIAGGSMRRTDDLQFMMLPMAEDLSKTDTTTTFTVENATNTPVSQLWIKLKNTAVQRSINLSGSDDARRWFAITENIALQEGTVSSDGTNIQTLTFPISNYHYFKISVNDKHKEPIKFLAAGVYTNQSTADKYLAIPGISYVKKDSDKATYITINLNDQHLVNRISLNIAGPKYYKRDVTVYQFNKQNQELISTPELNSAHSEDIFLSAKTNKLQLQIANNDNLPLTITGIGLWQTEQSIAAYLEAGQTYKLLTGDSKAAAPEYDLKFFTDSIHNSIAEIGHGQVLKNAAYATPAPTTVKPNYTVVIWVSIAIALALLSFLTFKMVREMKERA